MLKTLLDKRLELVKRISAVEEEIKELDIELLLELVKHKRYLDIDINYDKLYVTEYRKELK